MKKLSYEIKAKIVALSGMCFWFWGDFYSFLDACEVPKKLQNKYPQGTYNKYDATRNILTDLEDSNQFLVIQKIVSNFYRLKAPVDKDNLDVEKARKLLDDFRNSIGDDPIEQAIKQKEAEDRMQHIRKEAETIQIKKSALATIKKMFSSLCSDQKISPQKRGFELEKLFYEILALEEFDFKKPYKNTGEQIDGHFKFDKFDYLVEIKWEKEQMKQPDLSVFDGKIKGKAQSTRGLFFAINGFDDNSMNKFSGDSPRIILMDVQDFIKILEDGSSFYDCMKSKVDALVRYGSIMHRR